MRGSDARFSVGAPSRHLATRIVDPYTYTAYAYIRMLTYLSDSVYLLALPTYAHETMRHGRVHVSRERYTYVHVRICALSFSVAFLRLSLSPSASLSLLVRRVVNAVNSQPIAPFIGRRVLRGAGKKKDYRSPPGRSTHARIFSRVRFVIAARFVSRGGNRVGASCSRWYAGC